MKRLEIVHLRSSDERIENLTEMIAESLGTANSDSQVVTLYRRKGLETDVAVHIRQDAEGPSRLGLQLASALKAYGLVEHSMWEEVR
jgi:hypothetical protein